MTTLDPRLRDVGLAITGQQLLDLWAQHRPADLPVPDTCATCGHTYTAAAPYCPTAATIRPLLQHRRYEIGPVAIDKALTALQQYDLFTTTKPSTHTTDRPLVPTAPPVTPALFDTTHLVKGATR
jgi:hypothetical protein